MLFHFLIERPSIFRVSWYFAFFCFIKTFREEIIANKVYSAGTTIPSTLMSPGEFSPSIPYSVPPDPSLIFRFPASSSYNPKIKRSPI